MSIWLVLIILGSVLIIEALPLLVSPRKMKEYYEKISNTDSEQLRTVAFIMIFIGLVIVFLVRNKICL
ncbi:MAG: DUF2065 domain-containing protein [Acidobacteriota bacterium]